MKTAKGQTVEDTPFILIGTNGGDRVLIMPQHRSVPNAADYWDGNWVESEVRIAAGGFHGAFSASLRSEDFIGFRDDVRRLLESLVGVARFDTMEGQLQLALTGDGKGHVLVEGTALDQAGTGNTLKFTFEIDQTFLPEVLRSLDDVISRLPVVGSRNC